jgi:WD40 repeat protein
LASGKYFFCGVGQELHPGAIQIWKFPPEKINEIQAHGLGISRMRISYDNKYLFSASKDGSLMIMDIKDKDPRGGLIQQREVQLLEPSEEILTEKSEMEDYQQQKETYE